MTVPEQAEYYRILLAMGLVGRDDVIAWADCVLLRDDSPAAAVIDVSIAANADDWRMGDLLREVATEGDWSKAAHGALGRFKETLRGVALERAAAMLERYSQAARVTYEECSAASLFPLLYCEMIDGYWGTEAEIWERLGEFIHQYAIEPPAGV